MNMLLQLALFGWSDAEQHYLGILPNFLSRKARHDNLTHSVVYKVNIPNSYRDVT